MIHYYKTFKTHGQASATIDYLSSLGIDRENINIVMRPRDGVEIDKASLADTKTGLQQAPRGTISMFGATFAPIAAVTAGLLLIASGPMAAIAGAAAVGGGGLAMLLSGIGVPEQKHPELISELENGKVLIHVETDSRNEKLETILYDEKQVAEVA
jgi:hypothetical protein